MDFFWIEFKEDRSNEGFVHGEKEFDKFTKNLNFCFCCFFPDF